MKKIFLIVVILSGCGKESIVPNKKQPAPFPNLTKFTYLMTPTKGYMKVEREDSTFVNQISGNLRNFYFDDTYSLNRWDFTVTDNGQYWVGGYWLTPSLEIDGYKDPNTHVTTLTGFLSTTGKDSLNISKLLKLSGTPEGTHTISMDTTISLFDRKTKTLNKPVAVSISVGNQ